MLFITSISASVEVVVGASYKSNEREPPLQFAEITTARTKMPENTSQTEVPVALLSQALLELRAARGNREAEKKAAIGYFKSGVANGYQIGPLLEWLCFWPNDRESVFWQARLDSTFVNMLKKLSMRDLGLAPDEALSADDEKPSAPQVGP